MTKTLFAGILAGLIGGIAGAFLLLHGDRVPPLVSPATAAGAARSQEVVTASRIQLVDASGKVRAELAMSLDGGPALFFYDSAGRNRMVLGLYSPAEGEAPPAAPQAEEKPSPPNAPDPRAPAPVGAPLPTAEVLPDYKIAHAATESPVVGGNADTSYLTIVFGVIKKHMPNPSGYRPTKEGAVAFMVDEAGNLVWRHLVTPSGSPSLDLAMMNAIAQAAPYPHPPNWQPRSMKLVYGK